MVIIIILLGLIGGLSFYLCDKVFGTTEQITQSKLLTKIIFQISFILSNLFLSCIILMIFNVDSFQTNQANLYLWKLFLIVFSVFFYYLLPFYLIYNFFNQQNLKNYISMALVYIIYLFISNICYKFFNLTVEDSIFDFNFYTNYFKILEFLAFIGDLINSINGAYNAVNNLSSFLIYPFLKKKKYIQTNNDNELKKKLEEITDQISLKTNQLTTENNKLISDEIENLQKSKISLEYQLGVRNIKEEKSKVSGIINILLSIVKGFLGFFYIFTSTLRCLTFDYSELNKPVDTSSESLVDTINKFSVIKFSENFRRFIERVISLVLVILCFVWGTSVSKDRILGCFNYIHSIIKKKYTWIQNDLFVVFLSILISSYYLILGLLVVNTLPHLSSKDQLHKNLFSGFDYSQLQWYYDCPYVLTASFLIVKEIIEYSNLIGNK